MGRSPPMKISLACLLLGAWAAHAAQELPGQAGGQGSPGAMAKGECVQSGQDVDNLCRIYGMASRMCHGAQAEHETACVAYAHKMKREKSHSSTQTAELGAALESETKAAIEATDNDQQGITHLGLRACTQSGSAVNSLCDSYGPASNMCAGAIRGHDNACLQYGEELKEAQAKAGAAGM